MTSTDWNDYSHVRIHVVSWPPSEPIGNGLVRARWELETLTALAVPVGEKIDLAGISQDMSFDASVIGPQNMTMFCVCDESMQNPFRLGAATLAWRFIDENYARLWMIGGTPRAHYSGFMVQRRQMLEELIPSLRIAWLWLAMIRAEPMFAAISGVQSRADELLQMMAENDYAPSVVSAFPQVGIPATLQSESSQAQINLGEVRDILWQARGAATQGTSSGSIDLIASATERLFEALLIGDAATSGPSLNGLAAAEDAAWFDDLRRLQNEGASALPDAISKSRVLAGRLADVYGRLLHPET